MAITILTKNSTVASKRPTASQLVVGELGLNLEATDPGLFFEDTSGNIRKVGGAHVGTTAPNSTPAGDASLSVGELWYDTSLSVMKVWDGTAWQSVTDTQSFYEAGPWAYGTNRPNGAPLEAGDEWYDTSASPATAYVWDGTAWVSGSSVRIFVSDTVPSGAVAADLWFDSTTLETYIYYNDGTSLQWVQQIAPDSSAAAGTVTSVAVTGNNGITVLSGSPVTSAGTIDLSFDISNLPVLP